jgi:hypothetical protein
VYRRLDPPATPVRRRLDGHADDAGSLVVAEGDDERAEGSVLFLDHLVEHTGR